MGQCEGALCYYCQICCWYLHIVALTASPVAFMGKNCLQSCSMQANRIAGLSLPLLYCDVQVLYYLHGSAVYISFNGYGATRMEITCMSSVNMKDFQTRTCSMLCCLLSEVYDGAAVTYSATGQCTQALPFLRGLHMFTLTHSGPCWSPSDRAMQGCGAAICIS